MLFTSYDLLGRVFKRLQEPMARLGMTPLRQGEMNRHLSRFRKERNAVLFGTDSFWEGVDVQGKHAGTGGHRALALQGADRAGPGSAGKAYLCYGGGSFHGVFGPAGGDQVQARLRQIDQEQG